MSERDEAIAQNPDNTIYGVTRLTIFQRFPRLNLNIYDIDLVVNLYGVVQLAFLFLHVLYVSACYQAFDKSSKRSLIFSLIVRIMWEN